MALFAAGGMGRCAVDRWYDQHFTADVLAQVEASRLETRSPEPLRRNAMTARAALCRTSPSSMAATCVCPDGFWLHQKIPKARPG